jgi:hypothetical protein
MYCRSCGAFYDLPAVSHESYRGESRLCERCDGAEGEAAIAAVPDDVFEDFDAYLDREDDIKAHGDPFERDAEILMLFAPDQ